MYKYIDYSKVDMVYAMEGYLDDSLDDIGLESLCNMTFDEIAMEGIGNTIKEKLKGGLKTLGNFFKWIGNYIRDKFIRFLDIILRRVDYVIDDEDDDFDFDDYDDEDAASKASKAHNEVIDMFNKFAQSQDSKPSPASAPAKRNLNKKSFKGGVKIDATTYQELVRYSADIQQFGNKIIPSANAIITAVASKNEDAINAATSKFLNDDTFEVGGKLKRRYSQISADCKARKNAGTARFIKVPSQFINKIKTMVNKWKESFYALATKLYQMSEQINRELATKTNVDTAAGRLKFLGYVLVSFMNEFPNLLSLQNGK